MLRFGLVSKIHNEKPLVRVNFLDDNSFSYWLNVLQSKTQNDKFYIMPDIGEQVVCLMDEHSEEGVVLGSIYSDTDKSPFTENKQIIIQLENNSLISINKEENNLTIKFPNIYFKGNIHHDGVFQNTQGIKSSGDIEDKTSTIEVVRTIYNSHTHIGNEGKPTSTPNTNM